MATRFEIGYFVGLLVGEGHFGGDGCRASQGLAHSAPGMTVPVRGVALAGERGLSRWACVLLFVSRESSDCRRPGLPDSYLVRQLATALDRLQGPGGSRP